MEDMKKVNKKQPFPDTSNTVFGEGSNEITVAGSTQTKGGVFFTWHVIKLWKLHAIEGSGF